MQPNVKRVKDNVAKWILNIHYCKIYEAPCTVFQTSLLLQREWELQ